MVEKRRIDWMFGVVFERMEVSGNKCRELEILGKLYKPSRV
jgi:hypothetical protein